MLKVRGSYMAKIAKVVQILSISMKISQKTYQNIVKFELEIGLWFIRVLM